MSPDQIRAESGAETNACCSPRQPSPLSGPDHRGRTTTQTVVQKARPTPIDRADPIELEGGVFLMGTDDSVRFEGDGEGPIRPVSLDRFAIEAHAMSNERFSAFIASEGYVTDAERYGWSFVFHSLLPDDFPSTRAVASTPWWRQVEGADWAHPSGPQSDLEELWDHPVVHVSWNDAQAYCQWAGVRLPTEAEWEYAARGGLVQKRYAWGDSFDHGDQPMCNIFEGRFPTESVSEGGVGTAPVRSYPPNGYGLYNMAGNVWEWCSDWFSPDHHRTGPRRNPAGPSSGDAKVIRGGSYLCHDSYCDRYRVAARSNNVTDASTGNLGFRVAAAVPHRP